MSKCVLFDLDGTIVDTNELIIESLNHVLLTHCDLTPERERIIPHMGLTIFDQFKELSGRDQVDDLVQAYRIYNLQRHDEMVSLFPNVLEVVKQLDLEGFKLGVVTTKARETSNRVLTMFGLAPYMGSIVTVDDITYPKPHPEPIQKAIRDLDADPSMTWMIGDSPADMGASKAAGVTGVGVSWSLKPSEVLLASGADYMIDDMEDLYELCGVKRIHR